MANLLRWALLGLLVPLLVFALFHATRYDPQRVIGCAFFNSGPELMVFRGTRMDGRGSLLDESSCNVQVWDVGAGRLLRSIVTGHGRLSADQYSGALFDFTRDGQIRRLDSATFEPLGKWELPGRIGRIRRVAGNKRLVVVNWSGEDGMPNLTCLLTSDNRDAVPWTQENARGTLSADGRRLFVSRYEPDTKVWTTEVYRSEDASLTRLDAQSFDGYAWHMNPVGDTVLATVGLRNLRTGKHLAWTPPARLGQPWIAFFTSEAEYCVAYESGVLATYDVVTGLLVGEQTLSGQSSYCEESTVSPDQRLIAGATTDYRQVRVWNTSNRKLIARFPDHRAAGFGLAAAYLVWCLVWVHLGVHEQPHPVLDVFLVNGLLLVVLIAHAASRPRWEIHDAVIAASLALPTAMAGMLSVWWIHGGIRWSLPLAGMPAGLATIAAGFLAAGHRDDPGVWNVILGSVSYVCGLVLLLKSWRWRRWTIARNGPAVSVTTNWQLALQGVLIVTFAVALVLAVMRFSVPGPRAAYLLSYVSFGRVATGLYVR